jgi:hypothetical protein
MIMGPLNFDVNQVSIIDLLPDHIHISPVVCVDFSMANLTFQSNGTSVHTPNFAKPNQYRDLLEMVCLNMFSSELFVPVFGYGAKTFPGSSQTAGIFPVSMNMSNPLIPNQEDILFE